jgi:ATP-dependent helicase/nuclease subunit A
MTQLDPRTTGTHADATNPAGSAWVSANAGSGKTFVLSRRVIRLLFAGIEPSSILCLTFTKAAAAEMAKRVFTELGRWTTLPDGELAVDLAQIEGFAPAPEKIAEARRLFARALDTPGGLKVQTIHAFCERLLHQFPFEANVAGHFEVLDERDERALAAEAQRAVLARAAAEAEGQLGQALKTVLTLTSDRTHQDSVAEFVAKRDQIGAWIVKSKDVTGAIAGLRRWLRLESGETADGLRSEVTRQAAFDRDEASRLLTLLGGTDSKNDQAAARRLAPFVTSDDPELRIDAYLDFFMTGNGEFRSVNSLVTKKAKRLWPGLEERLASEMDRVVALLDRIRTAEAFESSVAMLRLTDAAIAEYDRLKRARGVLDFEDLVVKTVTLLARADASAWVHYKLDRGLDHILVDEAQDTSPRQWQVIKALAEEFFAGAGASDSLRTLFAVGDEKQSIFSFQGAVPAWFTSVQRQLGTAAEAGGYVWKDLELHLSFRSAPVVLQAVDAVFRNAVAHTGLAAEARPTVHEPFRRDAPGRVILWPVVEKPQQPEIRNWTDPVDYLGQESPEVVLAKRIAATVRRWLDSGEALDALDPKGLPKPITPGGILILVRYRGALTDAIIRELKIKGVPIAGADRLTLTEHIAVMDLMALGRAVILPEDDLSLAALLKSPLIGLGEGALYELAQGRPGSLWDSLWAKAAEREDFLRAKNLIDGWRSEADWRDPYAFFARILGPGGGRKAFLRRLGPEAEDVLDEFLAEALAFERTNAPSLEGFLAWLEASDTEIKRDTETLRDEVRVMTVHGAKGIEADIVFLVDNGTAPHASGVHDPRLLSLGEGDDPDNPGPFLWNRSIKHLPQRARAILEAWRERSREEYRRLLYVGMTRARDRLIVCGINKQKIGEDKDRRWHKLVSDALKPELSPVLAADGSEAFEWRAAPRTPALEPVAGDAAPARVELPSWATRPAPVAPPTLKRITPSSIAAEDEEATAEWRPAQSQFLAASDPIAIKARDRGRLVHRLLQSLPDIDPQRRQDAGMRFLDAFANKKVWSKEDCAALLTEVLAVMNEPLFAEAFGARSRAEVEVAGRVALVGGEATVAGRVDRLVVTDGSVLVVDYKTNRPAPKEVPLEYARQLALYRTLLSRVYPSKKVAAAILWTDGPSLVPLSDETLNLSEREVLGN